MTSRIDQPRGLDADQEKLWRAIANHEMPKDAAGVTFEEQLMREHGIRSETAQTAIDEYRKFMFLCATRNARNVPSLAVDLVWHAHLMHSRDYFEVFCKILGKTVHHFPGRVGDEQARHFRDTRSAYEAIFGGGPRAVWRSRARRDVRARVLGGVTWAAIAGMLIATGVPLLQFGSMLFLVIAGVSFSKAFLGFYVAPDVVLEFEAYSAFGDANAGDCGTSDGDGGGDCGGCGD